MLKELTINSYRGDYSLLAYENVFQELSKFPVDKTQFIVDAKVYSLYKSKFSDHLEKHNITLIEALEENKNIDKMSSYASKLMACKVKLDHTLVAIGGGITQDITCFLASTLFRGMQWEFVPTTLLAQADSCIGSKSSINVGEFKNLMGTFYPPKRILLDINFLNTLDRSEMLSGFGEILKVHMVKGKRQYEEAAASYDDWLEKRDVLLGFIWNSLLYKKELIEADEFDKHVRNVMNYGHTYGHAIESATHFGIPHGIAVSLGMDMANYQSYKMNRIPEDLFIKWHECLYKNYKDYAHVKINPDDFLSAISKDKKNIGSDVSLILVQEKGEIEKVRAPINEEFKNNCAVFLEKYFK